MLCNSLVQTLQHFLKNPLIFLTKISLKNHSQKLLRIPQIHFFPLLPWAAKTAPTEEFVFQNVAYRPTVYKTEVFSCFTLKENIILLVWTWHILKIEENNAPSKLILTNNASFCCMIFMSCLNLNSVIYLLQCTQKSAQTWKWISRKITLVK